MSGGIRKALGGLEKGLDRAKVGAKTKLGLWRKPEVQVFRGHGSPTRLRVTGRVVEQTGMRDVGPDVNHCGRW